MSCTVKHMVKANAKDNAYFFQVFNPSFLLLRGLGRTSLVAQWLRLHAPNAKGPGSIAGPGTRSHMHAATKSSHATTKEMASHS